MKAIEVFDSVITVYAALLLNALSSTVKGT